MILTTTRHGRSRRDVRNLQAHLDKQVGQKARVVGIGGVALSHADDALRYMEAMRDGSRAEVAMHHVTISPTRPLDAGERDEAVRRVLAAMGAEDHPWILWEHSEKARATPDGCTQHFHLVVGHVGPDGKALDDGNSYARLEAAARSLEADFGEQITHSRRTKTVAGILREMGREDVAVMLVEPSERPASATSSRRRSAAAREGIDLPKAQAAVREAWTAADSPAAFRSALREQGFDVAPGQKSGVFVVTKNGVEIGALDRIVKQKRREVAAKMEGFENVSAADTPAPSTDGLARSDESFEGGLRPIPGGAPSGAKAAAFALASGATGRGAGEPDREAAGHSGDDRARSAPAPSEPRGSPRKARFPRLEAALLERALTGFEPTQATKAAATEIKLESLSGRFARFTSAILDRQIGNGLDRLQRLAWDVRDVINDVRLRIRFGQAEQRTPLPEPEPEPTPSTPERFAGLRDRIEVRRRDEDAPEWTPPRPF